MKKILYPVILFSIVLLAACGGKYEGDFSYEIQDFTYTNQDGEQVSKSDFEGKFWIADFIYTTCETECPQMTYSKQKIERALHEEGIKDVEFVSFSIDPDNDTPEVLKEYGEVRGIDFEEGNWTFLTGYDFDTIKEFAVKSFKVPVEKFDDTFMHGTHLMIVSPEGNAIKYFNGYTMTDEQINELVQFIKPML
ncbi:SCO family protein [Ornithinibacillus halotolerans]|uniref:SCO1 protein n=1 Tax=Ornithinibacillus halotolerans TaxID=1274357 RepID=A0A916WD82_9BACI|nr:SCO family protein [Ornithinibacillus halotolerans]GGA87821.1 SCO1 protein [Ornithinibacillus halotolerans]